MPEHLHFLLDHLDETYHLMRESLEGNEPLPDAVLRGVSEEFGATGVVERYLGAKIDEIVQPDGQTFEKLTIYHAVRLVEQMSRKEFDAESRTDIEWHNPADVLQIYDAQCAVTSRPELDERVIVRRFMAAYGV